MQELREIGVKLPKQFPFLIEIFLCNTLILLNYVY